MAGAYVPLLIVVIALAAFLRDDFALTLIYLFIAAFAVGTWWTRRALSQTKQERRFNDHAFLGEQVSINIHLQNKGWLPLPWVEVRDTLPVELAGPQVFRRVTTLSPHA